MLPLYRFSDIKFHIVAQGFSAFLPREGISPEEKNIISLKKDDKNTCLGFLYLLL